jgi:hypothetical protein
LSKIVSGNLGSGTGGFQPSSERAPAYLCGGTADNHYLRNLDMAADYSPQFSVTLQTGLLNGA